jgi:hypothetical protein
MADKQVEYKATVFTVTYDKKAKAYNADPVKPPGGGGWKLVSCYEAPAKDQWTKALTAVWERE